MANKGQMTGMIGVYLVAAELSKQGWIVSVTSRSAAGADLLVTDHLCQKAWSVQVKTNSGRASFWLLGAHTRKTASEVSLYVFVNDARGNSPEFLVVRSKDVASNLQYEKSSSGAEWFSYSRPASLPSDSGWGLFGDPHADTSSPIVLPEGTIFEVLPDPSVDRTK